MSFSHKAPRASLNALRAFEAAGRLGSLTAAAGELFVTHGAVSRQIKALEADLGEALFEGPKHRRTLTARGAALLAELTPAFNAIDRAVRGDAGPELLRVSCIATFAVRWLIPRISAFHAAHPDLRVTITESYSTPDFRADGSDLAVRMALKDEDFPAGTEGERFMANWVGLVAQPDFWARHGGDAPETLPRLISRSNPPAWTRWADLTGRAIPGIDAGAFDHQLTMLEACAAGLGLAITQWPLGQDYLASGRLVAPFGFVRAPADFAILRPPRTRNRAADAFRAWLKATAAANPPAPEDPGV